MVNCVSNKCTTYFCFPRISKFPKKFFVGSLPCSKRLFSRYNCTLIFPFPQQPTLPILIWLEIKPSVTIVVTFRSLDRNLWCDVTIQMKLLCQYRISSNNGHPSINCLPFNETSQNNHLPRIITPTPFAIFSSFLFPPCQGKIDTYDNKQAFINYFSNCLQLKSYKTDQWWLKLWHRGYWNWKLIKETSLELLKSPCSVYLMWLFLIHNGIIKQNS